MIRRHLSGFGGLYITERTTSEYRRTLETRLEIGDGHQRFIAPQLFEIIQPAVEVLNRALAEYHFLRCNCSYRNRIVLTLTA